MQQVKPLSKLPGQFNQNVAQPTPWEEAIQKLTKATQAALEHQNHTIAEFKNEVRASQNLQAQSISNLENMMGQLASSVQQLATNIEKGKFPSQPFPNPKGVHNTGTDSSYQQEKAKSIITLRRGKLVDNQVEVSKRNTSQPVPPGNAPTDDSVQEAPKNNNVPSYIPKAPFPQRLTKVKQSSSINDIMEIFKQDDEDVAEVDMIETLVDDSFVATNCDNALNMCLTHFGSYFEVDSAIDEVNVLLESAPVMDTIKWKRKIEPLPTTEEKNIPSVQPPPKIELKELQDTLKYAFLGETDTLPVDEEFEIFVVEFKQNAALKSYFHEEYKFKFLRINDKWCKITRCKQSRSSNALFKVP
ncbi:Uncharacterized protein Adt_18394 [Abeliophyllum distichum]|uniref:Uncharacterized protein n=1 Tax=Abeliophyllum distichum TaxID=126358 RepID=A0ABD1TJ90_9LAMI